MDYEFEKLNSDFENELLNFEEEIDKNIHQIFLEFYDNLSKVDFAILDKKISVINIHMLYEALIHFILIEDYQKCAVIRNLLNDFRMRNWRNYLQKDNV